MALTVAVVVATSSLGAVIAAFSNTVNQAESFGAAILIVSAGLGGNFFPPEHLPSWLQIFSKMTINRWGIEGFTGLTIRGLGIYDILPCIAVLFSAALILFLLALWKFQRKLAS
jgi:ABC-2 type transport system permease protein